MTGPRSAQNLPVAAADDRVCARLTDQGPVAAGTIVVAMGSLTAALLAGLGIRVPVDSVKGTSITATTPRPPCRA